MSDTIDAQDLRGNLNWEDAEYFFNNHVNRNTELTFEKEHSKLVSKVDRAAMQTSFEGAKRFYHTAETYSNEVFDILEKYELN